MISTLTYQASSLVTTSLSSPVSSEATLSDYNKALSKLSDIVKRYKDVSDPRGKVVKDWADRALTFKASDFSPELRVLAFNMVEELRRVHLVNDLTRKPLVSPILDRTRVWEEAMFLDFKALCSLLDMPIAKSPFDGEVMEPTAHLFLTEMVDWVNEVSPLANQELAALQKEVVSPTTREEALRRLQEYMDLAQKVMNCEKLEKIQQKLERYTLYANQIITKVTSQNESLDLEGKAREDERFAKVDKQLHELKENNVVLAARVDEGAARSAAVHERLTDAEQVIANQKAAYNKLDNAFNQFQQHVAGIKPKSSCVIC